MISFYPGPSRIHSEVPGYFKDAYQSGILSINHRSEEFAKLYKKTVSLLRKKLLVPPSYSIFFTSSATENWEILSQSLTRKFSMHIFSGAFGEKWYNYAKHIHLRCKDYRFHYNEEPDLNKLQLPANPEMICLTHNETSNGTRINRKLMGEVRKKYAKSLICVDATSSMGGIHLKFDLADGWFASMQKCFGLPAGMGVLICSPRLIKKANEIGESGRYNSFNFLRKNYESWQTPYTPNVANIYMLNRVLDNSENIKKVEQKLLTRYKKWVDVFNKINTFNLFVEEDSVRSRTVIAVKGKPKDIELVKSRARKANFLLGNGYGDLKNKTIRIANFPALKDREVSSLQKFFKMNYT